MICISIRKEKINFFLDIYISTRSYFLVGDCPDPALTAKPDDELIPFLSRKKANGMYAEGAMMSLTCSKSKSVASNCKDGAWTPPLDCAGSNIIIHHFKIEKHT